MYFSMHKKVEHFCNASKITNVLSNFMSWGMESMKDILSKLHETLRNPFTRDEMR